MENQNRNNIQFIRYSEQSSNLFTKHKPYKVIKYDENTASFLVINDKQYESLVAIEFCVMIKDIDKYCICDSPDTNSSDTFTKCHFCGMDILI